MSAQPHPASFRDPSGFLFIQDRAVYRQVNQAYRADYDHLMLSGLYERLQKENCLVAHTLAQVQPPFPEKAYLVIRPEPIDFISYPYGWCFSQLKDAALLTIKIAQLAVEHGMVLKDASAYNIQFQDCRPILIDTLSFRIYQEGETWEAYWQFCKHFLAPLALISYCDVRLSKLWYAHVDGIPLDLASKLLPWRTYLVPGLMTHIHLHANFQKRAAQQASLKTTARRRFNRMALLGLYDSLESTVRSLSWKPPVSAWQDYYDSTNYSSEALEHKKQIVGEIIQRLHPSRICDIGANRGVFSRLTGSVKTIISMDNDASTVELNYRECKKNHETSVLPLWVDITNPSPALGWLSQEHESLMDRLQVDLVLALALIHHLAIGNNIPLDHIARAFTRMAKWLVIEFIPKEDSQVSRLLAARKDIFPDYSQEGFERIFSRYYILVELCAVKDSRRTIYTFERL